MTAGYSASLGPGFCVWVASNTFIHLPRPQFSHLQNANSVADVFLGALRSIDEKG